MGLHHRKLFSVDEYCHGPCYNPAESTCSPEPDCKDCMKKCLPDPDGNHGKQNKISTYLIITFAVVATAFFVLCCYAIYVKFFSARNRSRRRVPSSPQQPQEETHDEFLDEEHGPLVDHPIWYIRTPGLHQSIINAITVCKYKRGEGLIEGTDCSVCLSEFQEDESLRLLPKCNHAFHLPCIDTWLRSHTNCPMCRAPIVTNPARVPSMEPNAVDSSSLDGAQMEILENRRGGGGGDGDGGRGMEENGGAELRNGSEEEGEVEVEGGGRRVCENEGAAAEVATNVQPRRSVSLDSSSAAKISAALANVVSVEESHGNSKRKLGEANELVVSKRVAAKGGSSSSSSSSRTGYLQSAPASMKRSRSFNGKHRLSWYSRSQKKTNAPVRSF